MEAGARAIKEIHAEASRVDRVVTSQLRLAHMSGLLVSRVANLRRSVRMQLHTLKDLRGTMRGLRTVRRPNHQS